MIWESSELEMMKVENDLLPKTLKHFIQISHLWGKNSEADHLFENEEESRFNFLQIKGKTPVQTNKTSHQFFFWSHNFKES
jgi:hypothetical protein